MSRQLKRKASDRMEELEKRVRVLEAENAALRQQLMDLKEGETITLDLGSIPDFLKNGEYYANLLGVDGSIIDENPSSISTMYNRDNARNGDVDVDNDKVSRGDMISIPKKYFKFDTEIRPNVDLIHLLESLRYWMVDTLPDSVIGYALNTFESFKSVAEEFWVGMPTLKALSNVAEKGLNGGINEQIMCALEEHAPREIMQYLLVHHDTDSKLRQEVVITAAKLGSLECLQHILSKRRCDVLGRAVCMEAAKGGYLDCLKYAHDHGCPWDEYTCNRAAERGHLDCLKYAHENGCAWDKWTCEAAASGGHLDCLEYAHEHGCPWDEYTCCRAAGGGHLDCLKYAHEHGCAWDKWTCNRAANGGHLDCLKYAHEQGGAWDKWTCEAAGLGGHLDCLQYAHEHGCVWNEYTCSSAAGRGHLDCLKYAHENGCVWDVITCRNAAGRGHLECLKYAHEHGCPWDEYVCRRAAEGGHSDCLKYAREHGCPDIA